MAVKFSRRLVAEKLVDQLEQGENVQNVAAKLAAYLVETGQTRQSELFVRDIRRVLADNYGFVSAEVESANTLTDQLESEVQQFVQRQTNASKVEIISSKNPDLISGVVIFTTDAVYDGSLLGRLKKLKAV
jgi:F0F1-type ATP synthase delta subunit